MKKALTFLSPSTQSSCCTSISSNSPPPPPAALGKTGIQVFLYLNTNIYNHIFDTLYKSKFFFSPSSSSPIFTPRSTPFFSGNVNIGFTAFQGVLASRKFVKLCKLLAAEGWRRSGWDLNCTRILENWTTGKFK